MDRARRFHCFWLVALLPSLLHADSITSLFTLDSPAAPRNSGVNELQFPSFRFHPWDEQPRMVAQYATTLGYNESTWNTPGTHQLEWSSFFAVNALNSSYGSSILRMGFNQPNWDCYMNHYLEYWWRELEYYGLRPVFEALGWTEASWNGYEDPPASDTKFWRDLTSREREAAGRICYFQETWDGIPMKDWKFGPVESTETGAPTWSPTSLPSWSPAGTSIPTAAPTRSSAPSRHPTVGPSNDPTLSSAPSISAQPTRDSLHNSFNQPSLQPSVMPSGNPSVQPSAAPSGSHFFRGTYSLPYQPKPKLSTSELAPSEDLVETVQPVLSPTAAPAPLTMAPGWMTDNGSTANGSSWGAFIAATTLLLFR